MKQTNKSGEAIKEFRSPWNFPVADQRYTAAGAYAQRCSPQDRRRDDAH